MTTSEEKGTPVSFGPTGFFRSPEWLRLLRLGVMLAVMGGLSALAFVFVMDGGLDLVWPDGMSSDPFTGPIRIVVTTTVVGLAVGIVRHFSLHAEDVNVFGALERGEIDPKVLPGGVTTAMLSLIGGFSLGPEVPTGMLAGGLATKIAQVRAWDEQTRRTGVVAAVSSAWSGLFTSPYVSTLMVLELGHAQTALYWPIVGIQVVAALIGFAIFYAVGGGFAEVLRIIEMPGYTLELWHVGVALLLGVVGALAGVLFVRLTRALGAVAVRIRNVVVRTTLAGAALGLLGMALPLSLFLGTEGVVEVTEDAAGFGIGLLVVLAVAKIVATSGALGFGFIGGPIFPLLFVGASLGNIAYLVFPDLPQSLAVAAMMAAVPGGVVAIPLSVGVIAILITSTGVVAAVPVLTAAIVSFLIVRGLTPPTNG